MCKKCSRKRKSIYKRETEIVEINKGKERKLRNGNRIETFQVDGKKCTNGKNWTTSQKIKNKKTKITNGNGRKSLKILHWNMGSRKWRNKIEDIRQIIVEENPDIYIITEANLEIDTPTEERNVEGYREIQPLTMKVRGISRITALVKEEMDIEIKEDWMDDETSSIWMLVKRAGKKKLAIGAIYRSKV